MTDTKKSKKVVQEEPKVEGTSASPEAVKVMSDQDSYISDIVKEQPNELAQLDVNTLDQFNLLELPEECYPLHGKKYRFRWIAKGKNTEARLRSSVWTLCTRINAPFIKAHRFKDHGAVEQAGMLLAFCSEEVGKMREEAPAKRSADLVKHYTEELPNYEDKGFYKPKDAGGDDEEGLEEDRDF